MTWRSRAGVAQSTVSRCFLPGSELSPATRARVQEVAAALGYVPNALARSLITRRSEMVALIVTAFTLRMNPAIVSGIGRALNARGKQLLLMAVDTDDAAREAARAALQYPLDGLVLATALDDADVRPFLKRGVPVLSFNRPATLPRVDRLATNHAASAREIAELLHAAGHRRFLCVGGMPRWQVNLERATGFLDRLAALEGTDAVQVVADPSYEGRPTRVPGARAGAWCAGRRVLRERHAGLWGVGTHAGSTWGCKPRATSSVVGFDDIDEAAHQSYDLTTVRQGIDAMADEAVELLLRRLVQPDAKAQRRLFPGVLVRRGSGAALVRSQMLGGGGPRPVLGWPERKAARETDYCLYNQGQIKGAVWVQLRSAQLQA